MTQEGSKVVIVGGSSGIGFGVAEAIVERGADVILVGRSLDKLHRAARLLDAPQQVSTISADVTVEADVQRMFTQVGSFDHLVVTRGVPPPGAPIESTEPPYRARIHRCDVGIGVFAGKAHSRQAALGRFDNLHLRNLERSTERSGRRRRCRIFRLPGSCASIRAGTHASERSLTRLGRYADVG
jgi:NAD(P)-dependent dehydrogenase (short-subunit alcohol dehydrogenase family)